MTKEELSQLYWINREIEIDKYELMRLISIREGHGTIIKGMPKSSTCSDVTGDLAVKIADLEDTIAINIKKCLLEQRRLTEYINSIDDSLVRMILYCRYISGFNWLQVANHIGNNTADGVRKIHDRFLCKSQM